MPNTFVSLVAVPEPYNTTYDLKARSLHASHMSHYLTGQYAGKGRPAECCHDVLTINTLPTSLIIPKQILIQNLPRNFTIDRNSTLRFHEKSFLDTKIDSKLVKNQQGIECYHHLYLVNTTLQNYQTALTLENNHSNLQNKINYARQEAIFQSLSKFIVEQQRGLPG